MSPVTVVSVDLDGVGCYHGIHGLAEPPTSERHLVLERCLPRFLELFEELGVKATFFVVGHELEEDAVAGGQGTHWLRTALEQGHELANHTYAHAYDFVTWSTDDIARDLRACDRLLRDLGENPVGFRAPGYTHDTAMLAAAAELGYRYDSSALPSPPYYAAKVAVIAGMSLLGRTSESMPEGGRSFLGPRSPYRRSDVEMWELPMSVTALSRIPLIGTSLLSSPSWAARPLAWAARRSEYFHLELHGLDLADPELDGYAPALVRRQPELRTPLSTKRARLANLLRARGGAQTLRHLVEDLDR